ncbi:hypothetical protein F4814DRAFT_458183 [Daldinia grandis]|nr:hypothetical protein F4814DRAFT_458183 [Daldinia grandis]
MAEVFGTVIGACIDEIGCIHGGRHLGSDFQNFQLRLKMLELQLSRWGEASGINEDPRLNSSSTTNDRTKTAKDVLMLVLELLEESIKLREHAMQLISNITSLIDLLQQVYPMPVKGQGVGTGQRRSIDNDTKKAIESVETQGHQYTDVSMEENARIQNGHTLTQAWAGASSLPVGPSMNFTRLRASGSSKGRSGDVYVEKDEFWSSV